MNRILPLLLLALSSSLLPLRASTYFASPDGGGDGSSVSSPTTLQSGLKKLAAPGDTLYLLSGQYNLGNTPVQNLNGSASKRIVIAGYEPINRSGKYAAILDFRNTPYGTRGLQIKASTSYLHVKNLTLRYSGKNNLYNEGSFNLFENLDIYGSADTGCQMKGGGDNIIRNVDSHDNFDYKTMSGSTANFGGNADGFADKQFTGNGNHYIGCRAWNNSDDGWDFFQRVSSSNTVIEYSVCFRNGPAYYDMTSNPRVQTDKDWFESVVGTQLIDRYGNTISVSLAQYPCQGNGNGFKMGGQYTDHKVIVHHCLAVDNNARGFDQNNNGGTMWLYNNSAYRNVVNYGFTTAYGTNALQNNISFAGKNGDGYKSQSVIANDHNSWNTGFSVSKSDFQSLDTVQILAPRNGNSELPDGTFMHLTEGSQLIDRGIDVNLGYNGYAPDLGCYEYPGEHHDPDPGEDTYPAVQPEGTHAVAFVTLVGAAEDKPLLNHLRADERLWVNQTDATDPTVDYSGYELIVLGAKPNSGAAGFAGLKVVVHLVHLILFAAHRHDGASRHVPGDGVSRAFGINDVKFGIVGHVVGLEFHVLVFGGDFAEIIDDVVLDVLHHGVAGRGEGGPVDHAFGLREEGVGRDEGAVGPGGAVRKGTEVGQRGSFQRVGREYQRIPDTGTHQRIRLLCETRHASGNKQEQGGQQSLAQGSG